MLQTPPSIPIVENGTSPHVYVCLEDLWQCTKVPLKVFSVDTGSPLAIDSLLDSGATGMFIDVGFVKEQRLRTHPLPYAIPGYNIDGTANEAGLATKSLKVYLMYAAINHMDSVHHLDLVPLPLLTCVFSCHGVTY